MLISTLWAGASAPKQLSESKSLVGSKAHRLGTGEWVVGARKSSEEGEARKATTWSQPRRGPHTVGTGWSRKVGATK